MKKVVRKLGMALLVGGSLSFLGACEDESVTPFPGNVDGSGSSLSPQAYIDSAYNALQAMATEKLPNDATATGLSDRTVWDDWTLSSKLGLLNKAPSITPAELAAAPTVTLVGNLTADRTLSADTVYILGGRVTVTNNATLTIEKGTIIKGDATKEAANAATLMIAADGMIDAQGTAAEPIIMTSSADNIQPGQIQSPNLDETNRGNWGGLVLLGEAPISVASGDSKQIEGVPSTDTNGLYGGNSSSDNSGTLKYISIRHGGITLDNEGNEINGLTLGGVGSGTVIENIEVIANNDDGIEFFGGTVSVKNLLIVNQGDDGIDIDQAYSGTVDNFWVIMGADGGSDEGLEVDGREGAAGGKFTLSNGLVEVKGEGRAYAADFKDRAEGRVENVKFQGFKDGADSKDLRYDAIKLRFNGKIDGDNAIITPDASDNVASGELLFSQIGYSGNALVYKK